MQRRERGCVAQLLHNRRGQDLMLLNPRAAVHKPMPDRGRLPQTMRMQSFQGKGQGIRMICKPDLNLLRVFTCLKRKATLIASDFFRYSLTQKLRIRRTTEVQTELQRRRATVQSKYGTVCARHTQIVYLRFLTSGHIYFRLYRITLGWSIHAVSGKTKANFSGPGAFEQSAVVRTYFAIAAA